MKVAVIGVGGMGFTHVKALKALSETMDVQVVAIADVRKEFLDKALEEWHEARGYADGMELLEKEELDAVHICVPSYLHEKLAVAAMEKGIHVLVEKTGLSVRGGVRADAGSPETQRRIGDGRTGCTFFPGIPVSQERGPVR